MYSSTAFVRGRDVHCWTPPAQIRASPIRALGSYLGCLTPKRTRVVRTLRTRSSACDTLPRSCARHVLCWLALPSVPVLGSTGSAADRSALFVGLAATTTESDFSGSCIIGYDSSSSRCGPAEFARRSNPRSPGSRAKSFHTCQVLRPRRAGRALAITCPSISPSVNLTTSASGTFKLSRLNGWPMRSPTDASPSPSRMPTHGSGPMRIATPSLRWTHTTYSLPVSTGAPEFLKATAHRWSAGA